MKTLYDINKPRNTKSQLKKRIRKGLEGLEEDVHYKVLYEDDDNVFYQPLCYVASRVLASNSVPPSLSYLKNDDGEPLSGAKWCISYQKDRRYWDDYSITNAYVFVFHFTRRTKYAIQVSIYENEGWEDMREIDKEHYFLYKRSCRVWDALDHDHSMYIYYKMVSEQGKVPSLELIADLCEKAVDNFEYIEQYHPTDVAYTEELERLALESRKAEFFKDVEKKRKAGEPIILERDLDKQFVEDYGLIENGELTVQFDEVLGNVKLFDAQLTSLKNSPKKVQGDFSIGGNDITSFEGSPEEVGGRFYASRCYKPIPNLKGITQKVGAGYDFNSSGIESLEGLPEVIAGPLSVTNTSIKSFEGGPKRFNNKRSIDREIYCRNCNTLESFKGVPENTISIQAPNCTKLESLEDLPDTLKSLVVRKCTSLKTLEGCPKKMDILDARDTGLVSLKGVPEEVTDLNLGHYDIGSQLKDIDYWPKQVLYANLTRAVSIKNIDFYSAQSSRREFEERYPFIDYMCCDFNKSWWD